MDASTRRLSWDDAVRAAGEWLGQQRVGRDLAGQKIELHLAPLPYTGVFRSMVLEAIRRKLTKRGARDFTLPPTTGGTEEPGGPSPGPDARP